MTAKERDKEMKERVKTTMRLSAAAPDLLAALELFIAALEQPEGPITLVEAYRAGQRALRRVRGRQRG